MSPGHLEWPDVKSLFTSLSLCQSRSWWPNILKLGELCKTIGAYNLHSSYFSYWWPKARLILWPSHYQAIGEKPNPCFTHQARLFYHELSYARVLLMIQVQDDSRMEFRLPHTRPRMSVAGLWGGIILILLAGLSGTSLLKKSHVCTSECFFAIIIELYHLTIKKLTEN